MKRENPSFPLAVLRCGKGACKGRMYDVKSGHKKTAARLGHPLLTQEPP